MSSTETSDNSSTEISSDASLEYKEVTQDINKKIPKKKILRKNRVVIVCLIATIFILSTIVFIFLVVEGSRMVNVTSGSLDFSLVSFEWKACEDEKKIKNEDKIRNPITKLFQMMNQNDCYDSKISEVEIPGIKKIPGFISPYAEDWEYSVNEGDFLIFKNRDTERNDFSFIDEYVDVARESKIGNAKNLPGRRKYICSFVCGKDYGQIKEKSKMEKRMVFEEVDIDALAKLQCFTTAFKSCYLQYKTPKDIKIDFAEEDEPLSPDFRSLDMERVEKVHSSSSSEDEWKDLGVVESFYKKIQMSFGFLFLAFYCWVYLMLWSILFFLFAICPCIPGCNPTDCGNDN